MGKIRLLPDEVASQVAAGEVVERPASLVKELVENSVDAGARRIAVEFARGGTQLVRVVDDGCGMDREDALLSLERHATSKIRTADDLARVATMGFRGEAVPSIASVSRFRMVTRTADSETGTEIVVAGGKIESVSDSGEAPGTTVEVRSLFFNLPARRKFLRGEETEAAHIVHQMEALAIAHPGVAMSLTRDGRRLWQAAATKDPGVRLRDLFGADFLARLVPLAPRVENGITISGHLARPGEARPDRDQQFVVLNGRIVQCPAVWQPLREAYSEAIPKGRHPLAVLRISMDPLAFDCNVHPAKREIRLHRPDLLRQSVFLAARGLLDGLRNPAPPAPAGNAPPPQADAEAFDPLPARRPDSLLTPPAPPPAAPLAPQAPPQAGWELGSEDERFEIIGGLADRWIIMRSGDGLVLLDVRSTSERILFESLKRETETGEASSQRLLLPEVIELPAKDAVWISENLEAMRAAGFLLEPFGGGAFKVEALPACLAANDARAALLDLCDSLRASGSLSGRPLVLDALIRSVSCLASAKSFVFDPDRARRLLRQLLRCELPYAGPRGHPTMIQWSFSELERKFS